MKTEKRLDNLYAKSMRLTVEKGDKIVLISDCHRGVGTGADDFAKNRNLYFVAMEHYYNQGYTYIELGDGDELWKNRSFCNIAYEYSHVFELLSKMYKEGRLYMLYGNHDGVKKSYRWVRQNLYACMGEQGDRPVPLFPGIVPREGIVLQLPSWGGEILLVHGHQADFFNYELGGLSKLLVRYLWQPLELIGIQDPTSAIRNPHKLQGVEGKLSSWAEKRGKMLVAGHTHRAAFPKAEEAPYFNDGSCVHPRHISAIEIDNGEISLVRWRITTGRGNVLMVTREIKEGPALLKDYFQAALASDLSNSS